MALLLGNIVKCPVSRKQQGMEDNGSVATQQLFAFIRLSVQKRNNNPVSNGCEILKYVIILMFEL